MNDLYKYFNCKTGEELSKLLSDTNFTPINNDLTSGDIIHYAKANYIRRGFDFKFNGYKIVSGSVIIEIYTGNNRFFVLKLEDGRITKINSKKIFFKGIRELWCDEKKRSRDSLENIFKLQARQIYKDSNSILKIERDFGFIHDKVKVLITDNIREILKENISLLPNFSNHQYLPIEYKVLTRSLDGN